MVAGASSLRRSNETTVVKACPSPSPVLRRPPQSGLSTPLSRIVGNQVSARILRSFSTLRRASFSLTTFSIVPQVSRSSGQVE